MICTGSRSIIRYYYCSPDPFSLISSHREERECVCTCDYKLKQYYVNKVVREWPKDTGPP